MPLSQTTSPLWHSRIALPILMKEMRVRMRGTRAPALLFVATALAISVGLIIITLRWGELTISSAYAEQLAQLGRDLMLGLMSLELVLCSLITPGITAGAFSIEREQQTLDMLLLTPLSSRNILFAKLASAVGFVGILLLCAVPIAAISFVFGGVSPWQFLLALALIFAMTVCFGAIGLLCSLRFLRTSIAITVSYCVCLAWVALLPITAFFLNAYRSYTMDPNSAILGVVFVSLLLLVLATVPTIYTSLLISLIRRQRVSRSVNLLLWGAYASAASLLLYLPGALDVINAQYLLAANPAVALYLLLGGISPGELQNIFFSLPGNSNGLLFQVLFVLASIGLLCFGAWGAFKLAERELVLLRRPQGAIGRVKNKLVS